MDIRPKQKIRSEEIVSTPRQRKSYDSNKRKPLSFPSICPHILPMERDQVIGAPKINPNIGQVVLNPNNEHTKFLRYLRCSLNMCHIKYFRTTMAVSSQCLVCNKMFSSGWTLLSDPKTIQVDVKPILPGLNTTLKVRKADNNLSPFLTSKSKLLQYGDTSIESISTDNPMWSPGYCPLLSKYEGRFRRKNGIVCSKVISE